jgi:PGF-CTERM protein
MKTYFKQALACIALVCLLLAGIITPVTAQASGNYPATGSFNGMTIQYTISGVTVNNTTDVENFTTSRTLTGTVDPGANTVSVTGTVSMKSGLSADVLVSVSSTGGNAINNTQGASGQPGTQKIHLDVGQSEAFSASTPVSKDTTGVSVSIHMTGTYGSTAAGESRGLNVDGNFARTLSPLAGNASATAIGSASATATGSNGPSSFPGFEALYAVAGLLAVAYLVMRRRK